MLLCFTGWVVLYAGRAVLSPVLAVLGREWGVDRAALGLASSMFFFGYAAMQVPTGLLADRWGPRRLLVGGLVVFAGATALRGAAGSFPAFLAAGALAGLAQGTYYPSQFAISSAALPVERRSFGSAIIYSGMAVGTSVGYVLGGLGARSGAWRMPFVALVVPVLLVAALLGSRLPQPEAPDRGRSRDGAPGCRDGSGPGVAAGSAGGSVLSGRLLLAYALNLACLFPFFMLLSWLPYYLECERGFGPWTAGLVASLAPWASIPSSLAVSLLGDRLRDRLAPLRVTLPLAAAAVLAVPFLGSRAALLGALALYGLVGKSVSDPLLVARVADLAPPGRLATALGLLNFSGMLASVAAPYVAGLLAAATGSLAAAFVLAGAVLGTGALAVLIPLPSVGRDRGRGATAAG
ncbi:MAG: MFS transporter [Firmicutes bacterium]|nr:MFS transporter [Bacillota bacterium]